LHLLPRRLFCFEMIKETHREFVPEAPVSSVKGRGSPSTVASITGLSMCSSSAEPADALPPSTVASNVPSS
jgi:hypothetical protein